MCGLVSFSAALVGSLFVYDLVHGFSSGEGVLLIVGASPVALVGLAQSVGGRHATSHRWLAIAGAELSALAVVPFLVFIVYGIQFAVYCTTHTHGCY